MLSVLAFAAASTPALIPLPNVVEWTSGILPVRRGMRVLLDDAPRHLLDKTESALGVPLALAPYTSVAPPEIALRKRVGLDEEAYRLDVTPKGIEIVASSDAGLFYGIQTLRQLTKDGRVPACHIEDSPRFGWRGLLLDDSRHFWGPKYVRQFIDNMAAHKLNTFHWHLTDDGGWRMEVKRYPELTQVGAWRKEQGVEWDYGNLWFPGRKSGEKLYGGFYSQRQLRDMVRYAKERNVTIVPEIEMPGHSLAAAAAKPELQCEPPQGVMEEYLKLTRSQAPTMICPGKDSTIEFCKRVLDETMEIFPSKFIHIGADEVDKTLWKQCRHCQSRMKANGLKDEHELQSWFVRQMDAHLASKGRRLVGWDEILEGGLAPGATVMSWRGIEGGINAAKSGHDVVMSPTSHCYLDYSYDTIPTSKVYGYEPIPSELSKAEGRRILGGQGNVWTEWLSSTAEVDAMTYPRAAALAETLWTRPERKSWNDFEQRLTQHYSLMDKMGIAFQVGSPALDPQVLNMEANNVWNVQASPIPGVSVVPGRGTRMQGSAVIPGTGAVELFYQLPSGRRGEPTVGRVVRLKPVAGNSRPGLFRSRIDWKEMQTPPVTAFGNAPRQQVDSISLAGLPTDKPFALLFDGILNVPKKGRYTLGLGCDDGAVLYLDGQRVLENDGPHGYTERTVTIDLNTGSYKMQLTYFDAGGAQRLGLFWVSPGETRQPIQSFGR